MRRFTAILLGVCGLAWLSGCAVYAEPAPRAYYYDPGPVVVVGGPCYYGPHYYYGGGGYRRWR